MDNLIEQIATAVTSAKSLEALTRPILEMLSQVTGMESTYLTAIDAQQQVQEVVYAHNPREMQIPEGLTVPWGDTLCKRAIDSSQPFANDVQARWGDSIIGQSLRIKSYLSTPVFLANGVLYGTLCAASSKPHEFDEQTRNLLPLFATLIAQQVERDQLLKKLVDANTRLAAYAATDPLTQLANRRALQTELTRLLAQGARRQKVVLVALIDLDKFKAINDKHGHDVGDEFLVAFADRLRSTLRSEDFAARLGGDEFVVLALGPDASDLATAQDMLRNRLYQSTQGRYLLGELELIYAGASIGVIAVTPGSMTGAEALKAADSAMYENKRQRRAAVSAALPSSRIKPATGAARPRGG